MTKATSDKNTDNTKEVKIDQTELLSLDDVLGSIDDGTNGEPIDESEEQP